MTMYWMLNHNLLLLPILVASLCFGQGPGDKENIFNGGLALDGIPIPKSVSTTNGVSGKALLLDGDTFVAVPGTEAFGHGSNSSNGFSITLWFNVHELGRGQQMIISKNRYKLGQREWGVMVDKDDTVRLYARHGSKWETGDTGYTPVPGSWVHLHLQRAPGQYYLYLNHSKVGSAAATADAPEVLPRTATRIAVGGVDDPLRQGFHGAIDELRLFDTKQDWVPLAPRPKSWPAPHHLPEPPPPLWSPDATLPISKELNPVAGARFHVIKAWEPKTDGYKWLHGLSLAHHKGKLYASFGHNKGAENTASEEARYQVSSDDGRTWSAVRTLDTGTEAPDLAVSHGVFHVHAGKLYAFHGAFSGKMRDIHTRLYLNDESGAWENKGVVLKGGFWPMNQPQQLENGSWIMPGFIGGPYSKSKTFPAAVAIATGDDFTNWELVPVPAPKNLRMWGESALLVDGPNLLNIARYGAQSRALVARSADAGRTWTTSRPANLPMIPSKPAAGRLSSGEPYLVCTTTADLRGRFPLTIALGPPDANHFDRVLKIRDAVHAGPGESNPKAALAYPCAFEHAGQLYVAYSNSGGRSGNHNSAELAVLPVRSLQR